MRDPDTGQRLTPGQFIPAAERFQLGVQLDRHVIELALGWLEAGLKLDSAAHASLDVRVKAVRAAGSSRYQ